MRATGPTLRKRNPSRRGFTLIELLVVLGIMLVLAVLTYAAVNVTVAGDRIRSAGRQMQSYLEGARDRAIYAKEPRGVRFLLDPADATTVTSMVFIGPPRDFTEGTVTVNADLTLNPVPGEWTQLANRGLLVDGARIQLEDNYYTIARDNSNGDLWTLTRNHSGTTGSPIAYVLKLQPAVLPDQEPRLLPRGVVIDLDPDNSVLPAEWLTAGATLDVLFSPRGTVIGPVASSGRIHFFLADVADAVIGVPAGAPGWTASTAYTAGQWVVPDPPNGLLYHCTTGGTSGASAPAWPADHEATVTDGAVDWTAHIRNETLIVTLATATGNIASHPVFESLFSPPVMDPFLYAETGEVAR